MNLLLVCLAVMGVTLGLSGCTNTTKDNVRRRLTTSHLHGAGSHNHASHSNEKIPRIIHQIYLGFDSKRQYKPDLPEKLLRWREHCKAVNSEYETLFWSKRRIEHLIQTKYAYLWDTWQGWEAEWIKQADAARYIILNEFGGIYIDLDYSCQNPMDSLIGDGASIVLHRGIPGGEYMEYIDNSFMASTPHHWFWTNVLSELPVRAERNVLDATGPHMLHEVLYNVCGTKPEIKLDPFNRTYSDPDVEKYEIVLATQAMMKNVITHHNTGTWLGLYKNANKPDPPSDSVQT